VELIAPEAASLGVSALAPLQTNTHLTFDISLRELQMYPSFSTAPGGLHGKPQAAGEQGEANFPTACNPLSLTTAVPTSTEDNVALRHFLRLIVQDADGTDFWNTQVHSLSVAWQRRGDNILYRRCFCTEPGRQPFATAPFR
jgi:hypothetical protein